MNDEFSESVVEQAGLARFEPLGNPVALPDGLASSGPAVAHAASEVA
jgi:hypothetical protein